MDIFGTECARARESVSADLDCELHELDLRRLQAHLRVCADCSAWAELAKATTTQLREAPLETPAPAAFELPRRSRTWRVGPALAAAPAAALVASIVISLGGANHGALSGRPTSSTSTPSPQHRLVPNSPAVRRHLPGQQHRVFRAV